MPSHTDKDVGKGEHLFIASWNTTGTTTIEVSVDIPQEAENQSSYISLKHVPKRLYILPWVYMFFHVIAALFTLARNWGQPIS